MKRNGEEPRLPGFTKYSPEQVRSKETTTKTIPLLRCSGSVLETLGAQNTGLSPLRGESEPVPTVPDLSGFNIFCRWVFALCSHILSIQGEGSVLQQPRLLSRLQLPAWIDDESEQQMRSVVITRFLKLPAREDA